METIDAAKDPEVQSRIARLSQLVAQKVEKLDSQRRLSEEANFLLCRPGLDGLNEHARTCRMNLEVAITVSRRPGYFKYYTGTEEVKKVENSHRLSQLVSKIRVVQKEIDQVTAEIESTRNARSDKPPLYLSRTEQWMRMYGAPTGYDPASRTFEPGMEPPRGLLSTFTPNPKIQGKTSHHPAFRSQAVTLKKARITK